MYDAVIYIFVVSIIFKGKALIKLMYTVQSET